MVFTDIAGNIASYIMIGITCLILSYVTIMDNNNSTPAPITQSVYNQPNLGGSKKKTLRKTEKP